MKFHHFWLPPWKDLYGYFWKYPLNVFPVVRIFPTPMFLDTVDFGAGLFLLRLNYFKLTAGKCGKYHQIKVGTLSDYVQVGL